MPQRIPVNTAMQGMDTRMRMLLHRPPVTAGMPQQHFQSNQVMSQRMSSPRHVIPEQYELLQQQPQQQQPRFIGTFYF